MKLGRLDPPTRALVALSGAIATGDDQLVESRCRECAATAVPAVWVDELLLQSVLMVGWPRALTATAHWRRVGGQAAASEEDGSDYGHAAAWLERGESVCRTVYADNYSRLRENVRGLHPALEAWMVTEGYGRTLGRPGLDLARRELCIVAQVAVQGAGRQLHSHLRGALNAGAGIEAIGEVLEVVRPLLGSRETEVVTSLWDRIKT